MRLNILIIGGNGFVGKHLVRHLIARKYRVTVLDIKKTSYLEKIAQKKTTQIIGDFNSKKTLEKAFNNVDVVYHLAGLSDLNDTLNKPLETVKSNIVGTINVLQECIKFKIKRFIYASTVYVHSKEGGFYKCSKIAAENYIREFSKLYGLKFTILRYGSIYGPGANESNGVYRLIKKAIKNKVVDYEGDPETIREYVHVEDVARGSIEVLKKEFVNQHINISGVHSIKIDEFIKIILETLNFNKKVIYKKKKQIGHYIRTPYSFEDHLGIKLNLPLSIDFGQGILQMIKELKKEGEKN